MLLIRYLTESAGSETTAAKTGNSPLAFLLAIVGANYVGYSVLLVLWLCAGLGQSLAEIPSETLIGEQIEAGQQGKVFGSHFAFSHLWWAIAYPIAGFTGRYFPGSNFMYGGLLTLGLLGIVLVLFRPKPTRKQPVAPTYS